MLCNKQFIALFDGHESHENGLAWQQLEQESNGFGFCLKSNDSIRDQVNDNGPNALVKSIYDEVVVQACHSETLVHNNEIIYARARTPIHMCVFIRNMTSLYTPLAYLHTYMARN